MLKWIVCSLASLPVTLVLLVPQAGAAPSGDDEEMKTLKAQQDIFKKDIAKYKDNQAELAALNRARTGMAIAIAQEAILTLKSDAPAVYDEASRLIRESESYNLAIDTSTLGVEDLRVHADLQALSRRALAAQVDYLRRQIGELKTAVSSPQVIYVPVTYQPAPTYYYCVTTPVPATVVHHRGLFRCSAAR